MSLRGTKRATVRGEEPSTSKRRRAEPEDALWQLRPVSDLKMSSIYNRSASEAPAELFRKDLISAMKLPDSEPLTPSEYWVITDAWKQEWERGVQVPVNPDSLPAPKVKEIENPLPPNFEEFKLPKDKYIHLTRDSQYKSDKHLLSTTPARAEAACSYDLDATDTAWLKLLNSERARAGALPITEDQFEKVLEELEVRTWDKIQSIIKSEEGLGIEYDENVICDVCRSPDSEDGNEMVFCDSCNICVHQACYGITVIPDGQWLCRPCGDGVRPTCVLCPNQGGAMKCTPSGHKWAHVSCVLWIPEVSIGCAEKMEPITKISSIPASRWSLVCVLCRERKGACIQCSVKTCKTAYHVTCAFKHGLEMRAIIEDENADDGVKLRSYCQKHSVNNKKDKEKEKAPTAAGSGSEEEEVKRKRRKDMTSEEKTQARAARLQEIEREFDRHVTVKDISTHLLDVDQDAIVYIYNYWKLKRRSGHNRPLLPPKSDDSELLTHRQEQADLDKMKMFVQLRQDLERVRNLCYMVSRREKLSRSFFRMREQTFHKQLAVLSADPTIKGSELSAIIEANHGPSIYDRLYSHPNAPDHKDDFEALLARIAPPNSEDEKEGKKKKDRNGLVRRSSRSSNPYKKHYVNGSRRSGSMYSGLSSEESAPEVNHSTRYRGRACIGSSTDDEGKKKKSSPKKKKGMSFKTKGKRGAPKKAERKKKNKSPPKSKALVESSSEDEALKAAMKKDKSQSNTLQQMEKEMKDGKSGQSGTDSDDLIPMKLTRNSKFPVDIYSDSSDEASVKPEKSVKVKTEKIKNEKDKIERENFEQSPSGNDSQQSLPRTKGAMKEFIPSQSEKKESLVEDKPAPKKRGRKPSNKSKKPTIKSNESDDEAKNKENIKFSKQKDNPTDLIVPQRQAAKKASENMRSTTGKKEEIITDKQASGDEGKSKLKPKSKGKEKPAPITKKSSKDAEKETIAYVPQRQAAKKAAAHIKSGLGSKIPVAETTEKLESIKVSPKKEDVKSKTPQKESASDSHHSNDSSASSSEEEHGKRMIRPTAKAREIKPVTRHLFSPPGPRPTVDLPFLDKVSRPLSSTSASSDSESSKGSRYSGSSTPVPKRPRRRRKGKSISTDTPRKAPDKKLKTSERRSECRVSSESVEGEKLRTNETRAATRSRTRSTTTSGNLLDKSSSRQRKSSKDDVSGPNKTPKESSQPSKLSTPERKKDEEIKKIKDESPQEVAKTEVKPVKGRRRTVSVEAKKSSELETPSSTKIKDQETSPRKTSLLQEIRNQTKHVKETTEIFPKEIEQSLQKARSPHKSRRPSILELQRDRSTDRNSLSPIKKPRPIEKISLELDIKNSPHVSDDFIDKDKHWLPKPQSPYVHPPPVEKPGDHEKYMTEDKVLDLDSADKSSIKMIAKIQANLNENMMIKSPKTPMDARTINMDNIDIGNPMTRNKRKCSTLDSEKKFITQDANHVQGVEISKSAKIPSAVNPFPNRSMFSPQSKDNELFDLDMLSVDDGFNHDDMIKPFTSYPEFFFKEDSKEQGVQETLNLVDRLRMQLTKKVPTENSAQDEPIIINDDKDEEDKNSVKSDLETSIPVSESLKDANVNHTVPRADVTSDSMVVNKELAPILLPNDKWGEIPVPDDSQSHSNDRKYNQGREETYSEEIKEPASVQLDSKSISTAADTISISKQSDDSQSISVVDHSVPSNDPDLTQDNQNYENNNSMLHSDCATIPSPSFCRESKWRESKIATRRSSASSTNSEGSVCSRKTDLNGCDSHQGNVMPDIDSYPPIPAYSCPVEPAMPLNQYSSYPPDASPFLTTMGTLPLFAAGACASSQLPLPSPGSGLYGPSLAFPTPPLLPALPKPAFPTLCAAFTSSSQNIALTTAMIAPPTPKTLDSPRDDTIDVTESDKFSIHVASESSPSISVGSFNEASNSRAAMQSKLSLDSNETMSSMPAPDEKSPTQAKGAKVAKFSGKSPGKSPGISPKQSDTPKGTKRPSNRSNRNQRGRGRSKSRGHGVHNFDYMGNSISKLVGTVYDFKEEVANDSVDLKALRDKRKSIDVRDDRKSETSYKDSSQSPSVVSPQSGKKFSLTTDLKDAKRPSPPESQEPSLSPTSKDSERGNFSQVQPVLPGPVDMRTYNPFDNPTPATGDAYHSHLLAFASGTAEQPLMDIDEEVEKQLHSELMASKPKPGSTTPPAEGQAQNNQPGKEILVPQLPKVSLSDSRNQLKVKIKGPFLDANYSASSSQPPATQPPAPAHETNPSMLNANSGAASSMMTGSTNLRRMRKKELLRQYWTQDMNMDEPTNTATMGVVPPPAVPPPLTRAVITIPKAVASMTSIPTREDYKNSDAPIEKKKRKTSTGPSRELRQLKVSMNDDVVDLTDSINPGQPHKRRSRICNTKPNRASVTSPVAPKLKIKIGSNVVQQVSEEFSQFRPPKKRLSSIPKPSLEDLRRESMKYRKMVMADFEKDKKKKDKPSKSESRSESKSEVKKKKDKRTEKEKVKLSESAPKLIIKIKRDSGTSAGGSSAVATAAAVAPELAVDPFEYDPTAPDPLAIDPPSYAEATFAMRKKIRSAKVTPIRLKLSRSSQGSGYVMKTDEETSVRSEAPAAQPALPLTAHCQVR